MNQNKTMFHEHNNHLPCLHCHPHSYIRMVQHLIERCLLFRMSRDDCVEALAMHASIQPLITLTVWKELIKENRAFFHGYFHGISTRSFNSWQAKRVSRFGRKQLGRSLRNCQQLL